MPHQPPHLQPHVYAMSGSGHSLSSVVPHTPMPSPWPEQTTQYEGTTPPRRAGDSPARFNTRAYSSSTGADIRYERQTRHFWAPPSIPHPPPSARPVPSYEPSPSYTQPQPPPQRVNTPPPDSALLTPLPGSGHQPLNQSMKKNMITNNNSGPTSDSSTRTDCGLVIHGRNPSPSPES